MHHDDIDASRRAAMARLAALAASRSPGLSRLAGGLVASAAALVSGRAAATIPIDTMTVMYQRESDTAATRLDPVVRTASLALERAFVKGGMKVVQVGADVQQLLEQGPSVIITFASDSGLSLLFSIHTDMRPSPGQDAGIADVRIAARLFVGRHVLAAEDSRGQMATRLDAAVREFGTRRAFEVAAQRAGESMAEKILDTVGTLTRERIDTLIGSERTTTATAVLVPVTAAPPGQPVAPPSAPTTPTSPGTPGIGEPVAPPPLSATPTPASTTPLAAPAKRYALVIGVSDYAPARASTGQNIPNLKGVATDVAFVVRSLRQLGYAESNTRVLFNADATSSTVRAGIKDLVARAGPEDSVLIFVSGHGADKNFTQSGFGMPILSDYKSNDSNAVDFFELQSYVKNMRSRVVWINDTCHSGGAAMNVPSVVMSARGIRALPSVRGPEVLTVAASAAPGQDFAILTACEPSELSLETAEGGLFTTALFGELLRTRGETPLAQVFSESVARTVINRSKQICQSGSTCEGRQQQTPVMAVSGRGALLRV